MSDNIRLKSLDVLHYKRLEDINEDAINNSSSPLVVIQYMDDYDNKHFQIRVRPFNKDHTEKEALPFENRLVYYKRELRNVFKTPPSYELLPESDFLASLVTNYFTAEDGFEDEFAEFMLGWNTKPYTGYENNMMGFFEDHYLGLTMYELNEFALGMA